MTLQPLRRFELDAAILFSDIMTPLQGMGVDLYFEPGPVVRNPIRTDAQIDALAELVPERDVPFVLESIKLIRPELPRGAPLIGFAGGPFTLLCYLVSGKPSKEFGVARSFLYSQPELGRAPVGSPRRCHGRLPGRAGGGRGPGPDAVRILGGTVGAPRIQPLRVARGAPDDGGTAQANRRAVDLLRQSGLGAHGSRCRPGCRCDRSGLALAAQRGARGCWAPTRPCRATSTRPRCLRPRRSSSAISTSCCRKAARRRGHIFNLGHGIWPETSPDAVARLVDHVHAQQLEGTKVTWKPGTWRTCAARGGRVFPRSAGPHLRCVRELRKRRQRFEQRNWSKPEGHRLQGGGESRLMRGEVFEKVGVNFSHVWGEFSPQARGQVPGAEESQGRFVACGISLVAHMTQPLRPRGAHESALPAHQPRLVRGRFGPDSNIPVSPRTPR